MVKRVFLLVTLITFCFSEDFSDGPYGTGYFDIAGPFELPDLNMSFEGDVNYDEIINIQDIILVVSHILGSNTLYGEQFDQGDINNDSIIDILDIVNIVDMVLHPSDPLWSFENEWTGEDSYIFIHYDPSVGNSTALWGSNTKQQLLEDSPMNVHYFFISSRSQYESDLGYIKSDFDSILSNFSEELQAHWKSHLHFVNVRSTTMDNWLSESLSGTYGISIDCFQRIREIGYLGNPASFT